MSVTNIHLLTDFFSKKYNSSTSYVSLFNVSYKNYILIKRLFVFCNKKRKRKDNKDKRLFFSRKNSFADKNFMFSIINFVSMNTTSLKKPNIINNSFFFFKNINLFSSFFKNRFRFVFLKRTKLFLHTLKCLYKRKLELRISIRSTDNNFFVSILTSIPWIKSKKTTINLNHNYDNTIQPLYVIKTISGGRLGVHKKRRFLAGNFKYSKDTIVSIISRYWVVMHKINDLNIVFESNSNSVYLTAILKSVRNYFKHMYWDHLNLVRKYKRSMKYIAYILRFFKRILKTSRFRMNILYQFYRKYLKRIGQRSPMLKKKKPTQILEKTNKKHQLIDIKKNTKDNSLNTIIGLGNLFLPMLYRGKKKQQDQCKLIVKDKQKSGSYPHIKTQSRLKVGKKLFSRLSFPKKRLFQLYTYSAFRLKALNRFPSYISIIKSNMLFPHNGCKLKKLNTKGRRDSR